jgi:hypothetical protein
MLRYLSIACATVWIMGASVPAGRASVPKVAQPTLPGAAPQAGSVPVLVELFTSEACAVCPAAGDVLHSLELKQPIPGVEIIGLEMRMDAWNAQGYRDPFALRQMTNRQNEYVRLFKLDNLLIPQMVIGGQVQLSGADAAQARNEIARAAKNQKGLVEVSFQSASVATVKVDKLPSMAQESEIWMAVTESPSDSDSINTSPLRRTGVVRSLVMLGTAEAGQPVTYSMHLRFNPRWRREDLKYVVFVQERISRKIWAATVVTP